MQFTTIKISLHYQFSRRCFSIWPRLAFLHLEDQIKYSAHRSLDLILFISQIYDRPKPTSAPVRLQSYSNFMASTIALGIGIATAAFLVSNPAAQNTILLHLSMLSANTILWNRVEQVL
jgi:hypothetical protein